MYYIIQENLFKEFHHQTLIKHLTDNHLDYEIVKFRPFVDEIEFKTDRKDVWVFGSTNLARVAEKYGWNPGSMYNDNHDLTVYGPIYGDNMLNNDGAIIKFGDSLPEKLPYAFFARPTKDTKSFSGQCFTHDSWAEWQKEIEDSNVKQKLTLETEVFVAPLKQTTQEIRCWIVGGEVVTMSQYKIGSRVVLQNMDNNEEALIFANKMAKLYSPAEAYVLDICLFNDDYKVVEINCINCSGFYDLNMNFLIEALELKFDYKGLLHQLPAYKFHFGYYKFPIYNKGSIKLDFI